MSFEQLNNEEKFRKKKKTLEQEKAHDFFLEKKILLETTNLLQSLAQKISQDFGIDISEVKELISGKTLGDLGALKSNIGNKEAINLNDLQNAIFQAKKSIEDLSKKHRESLKKSLEKNDFSPEKHDFNFSKKIFKTDTFKKAYSPQKFSDHIVGAGIGLLDSTEAVILFSYGLGKGILLTPYHLYLIIMGKAQYKGFKNI